MNKQTLLDRRTVLKTAGAATLVTPFLAGCGSTGNSDGGDDSGNDGAADGGGGGEKPSFDGWMEDVDNYDEVVDKTGSGEVTVVVGSEANGGNFGFEPPVIRIATGTTVTWEWNGLGGQHNVTAENGDFESELTDEEGFTFSETFDETESIKYACTPHKAVGMKGVVIVE